MSEMQLTYVLVTPARNEETFIEGTIRSVIAQTVRPKKWVIVSDGSTDGTDAIVQRHANEHSWIQFVRAPEHRDRQFAAKARCFAMGYEHLQSLQFDLVGNLDADITMGSDYYEFLLGKFAECLNLGVAGTPFVEDASQPDNHSYAHGVANLTHVSGACQMFRRKCFTDIGGYPLIKGGAIDWIAVTTARMRGWETRTFLEKICYHHRKIGTGNHSPALVRFHYGRKAYYVGGHPLWETLRGFFQIKEAPLLVGGFFFLAGYWWASISRMHRPVSSELIAFHRAEQLTRLRGIFRRTSRQSSDAAAVVPSGRQV
jgi:glycosyltransferase involved in cell wall biosynthesis